MRVCEGGTPDLFAGFSIDGSRGVIEEINDDLPIGVGEAPVGGVAAINALGKFIGGWGIGP